MLRRAVLFAWLSPLDNLRVLKLLKKPPKPTIAFCMGDLGIPSRILGAKFGTPFAYAAFNKERGIAPGMPSFEDVKKVYDIEPVNDDTTVYIAHNNLQLQNFLD